MTQVSDIYPSGKVILREVGLRDGLQMVKQHPTTEDKKAWIQREFDAGVRCFELGSFLPAQKFPQFADIQELIDLVGTLDGAHGSALALNRRGAEAAVQSGVAEITAVLSASEAHSKANINRTRDQAVGEIEFLVDLAKSADHKPLVSVGIAMAFGCSISGDVDPETVLDLAARAFNAGVDVISLADTVGYAGPSEVATLCRAFTKAFPNRVFGIHLHDTRGLGLANALAAIQNGATIIDGATAGLGGCPFAPNATGNIVFEDLVFLCQKEGIETGIEINGLLKVRDVVQNSMPQEALYGSIAKAGLPRPTGLDGQ
ncbi:hydroxymethylglutaryl-CoA lyase [Sneathiella sp. P13V-1]|uniref:hydroxymethylglutaryl-CoA lyase n=1 Tax=Sneathiella sp. P13V-1 TaxID=2697366 RepID=UPI00187B1BEC|nr:hydroxymethylglutaryl-CoA lyase [Sneathiella sp. P13V-1]MBE7636141.1 hydroxymethylglutaryl-CoA lyase [Sneathiella sp. P13V-1]